MLRMPTSALAIASLVAFSAIAQSPEHPPTVTADGAAPLPRAGEATRVHLLGLVELYSLAVYADAPTLDPSRLRSPDVPKALRIEIRYKDDLRRQVTIDWRRELVPALNSAAAARLKATFAPLRHVDVVLVEYAPGKGTTVRADAGVVVSEANHDLMLAFLDHWLGQRPVSDEMKRTLTGSPRIGSR